MELKNFEPKTTNDIILSILIDSCVITNSNDEYRQEESAEEVPNFEVGV